MLQTAQISHAPAPAKLAVDILEQLAVYQQVLAPDWMQVLFLVRISLTVLRWALPAGSPAATRHYFAMEVCTENCVCKCKCKANASANDQGGHDLLGRFCQIQHVGGIRNVLEPSFTQALSLIGGTVNAMRWPERHFQPKPGQPGRFDYWLNSHQVTVLHSSSVRQLWSCKWASAGLFDAVISQKSQILHAADAHPGGHRDGAPASGRHIGLAGLQQRNSLPHLEHAGAGSSAQALYIVLQEVRSHVSRQAQRCSVARRCVHVSIASLDWCRVIGLCDLVSIDDDLRFKVSVLKKRIACLRGLKVLCHRVITTDVRSSWTGV